KGPMQNPVELGGTHDLVVRAVAGIAGYAPFFRKAFGDSRVTLDRIAGAISDYERTRVSGNSPWDRWRRLGDRKALTPEAMRGDALFFGKARCSRCHIATVLSDARFDSIRSQRPRDQLMLVGNSFTDWRFHNTGIGWDAKAKRLADPGRAGVTGRPADAGAFKTPGLRDTALHPPYMHDGSLPTLEAVIEHYRRGGVENPSLDPLIEPLELSDADVKALVAMLRSLTGEGYQDAGPALFPR
ncbi:MAG: hypothetical protein HY303_17600, partial [Candidatus Wallbacteria bacterium]|nr:hypothetical protein [Candidatus Wallbacteria bacterium]